MPRSTTTAPRSTPGSAPTTTTPEVELPGLWISLGVSINDERGTQYATATSVETLRAPLDDGQGGVLYLRCPLMDSTCGIERKSEPDDDATSLGAADDLLAVGTLGGRPVVLTASTDPAITPSFENDTSGRVASVLDLESGDVLFTYDWFGWESGPMAVDVESDRFVLCSGEGFDCQLSQRVGAGDATDEPFPGLDLSPVSSLALSADGARVTWVTTDAQTDRPIAVARDLATGALTPTDLSNEVEPELAGTDTDGQWAVLLIGDRFRFTALNGSGQTGQLVAPPEVLSFALRSEGGAASGGPSPL